MATSTHHHGPLCTLNEDNQDQQEEYRYKPSQGAKGHCDQRNASGKSRKGLSSIHRQDTCAFLPVQSLRNYRDMSVGSRGHDVLDCNVQCGFQSPSHASHLRNCYCWLFSKLLLDHFAIWILIVTARVSFALVNKHVDIRYLEISRASHTVDCDPQPILTSNSNFLASTSPGFAG